MVDQRNRIVKIKEYLCSLGITVNIGKNKARGNRGVFLGRGKQEYRIDIAKNLSEENLLSVLIHEFAHYIHYKNDAKMEKLDFICKNMNEEIQNELINITVDAIPKEAATDLFNHKENLSKEIRMLAELIKTSYPDFKLSFPCKEIEKKLKFPVKYFLKYDKIRIFNKTYSIEHIEDDFKYLSSIQLAYISLKSKQRVLSRIKSKIAKLNKYYIRPAELFARFAEVYFLNPAKSQKLAPLITAKMTNAIMENKIPEFAKLVQILSNVEVYK